MTKKLALEIEFLIKSVFLQYFGSEEQVMKFISQWRGHIERNLSDFYLNQFPLTCQSCHKTYKSRQDYLNQTKDCGTLVHHDCILEFRDCVCGKPLGIETQERRDLSAFGVVRRELFDLCVSELLKKNPALDKEASTQKVRQIFREINRGTHEFLSQKLNSKKAS